MSPTSPRVSALPRVPEREIGVETVPSAPVHRAQIVTRFAPLILALVEDKRFSADEIEQFQKLLARLAADKRK